MPGVDFNLAPGHSHAKWTRQVSKGLVWFLYIASPQQGELRLSGTPSGQGAGGGTRTHIRRVPCRSQGGLANHYATDASEGRDIVIKNVQNLHIFFSSVFNFKFALTMVGCKQRRSDGGEKEKQLRFEHFLLRLSSPEERRRRERKAAEV
ncbi:hypothetical protein PoB_001329900 [Plakobranchus ocellatus]|uniref:Uncharacterized protein n=1 Tax=Plakobranchus ocellatus TaxID=259542 RepID=A0AAV3YXK6_9GAST|nr:hypothetical protein PoB_001329900 [Plakobranchus ocellatus]